MQIHETYELAKFMLDGVTEYKDDELDELEDQLMAEFNVDFDHLSFIVEKLLPMIEVAKSPLSGCIYKGFANHEENYFIVKKEVDIDD